MFWLNDLTRKFGGSVQQRVMKLLNAGFNLDNSDSKVKILNSIGNQFNHPINLELTQTTCVIKDEFGNKLMSLFKHSSTGSWVTQ